MDNHISRLRLLTAVAALSALTAWSAPAFATFSVSQPDKPDCSSGRVRQIGVGHASSLASASAGGVPLKVATKLVLPGGWVARIGSGLSMAPTQWRNGDTWAQALTSAKDGCYTIDWRRHVFEASLNPEHGSRSPGAESVYVLMPGSLKAQVKRWAAAAGRKFSWTGPDFHVTQRLVLTGTLEGAVREAFTQLDLGSVAGADLSASTGKLLAVRVSGPPPKTYKLDLVPGSLRNQLLAWTKRNGLQLAWLPSNDYLLGTSARYQGSITGVCKNLAADLHGSGVPVDIRYKRGNHTVVVEGN